MKYMVAAVLLCYSPLILRGNNGDFLVRKQDENGFYRPVCSFPVVSYEIYRTWWPSPWKTIRVRWVHEEKISEAGLFYGEAQSPVGVFVRKPIGTRSRDNVQRWEREAQGGLYQVVSDGHSGTKWNWVDERDCEEQAP